MIDNFKNFIVNIARWLEENMKALLAMFGVIYMVLIVFMALSISIAFWLNGLYPQLFNFEIALAYAGVGTLVGGLPAFWSMYKTVQANLAVEIEKYKQDSQFNTIAGVMPDVKRKENIGKGVKTHA